MSLPPKPPKGNPNIAQYAGNGGGVKGMNKGNTNGETHSVITFRNRVKRRVRKGRSLIDRRTTAGRNAVGWISKPFRHFWATTPSIAPYLQILKHDFRLRRLLWIF